MNRSINRICYRIQKKANKTGIYNQQNQESFKWNAIKTQMKKKLEKRCIVYYWNRLNSRIALRSYKFVRFECRQASNMFHPTKRWEIHLPYIFYYAMNWQWIKRTMKFGTSWLEINRKFGRWLNCYSYNYYIIIIIIIILSYQVNQLVRPRQLRVFSANCVTDGFWICFIHLNTNLFFDVD